MISPKTVYFPVLLLLLATGCAERERMRVTSKDELYVFLDSLERRYEKASSERERAKWNAFAGENWPSPAENALQTIFQDTMVRNTITEWRDRAGSLADKILSRRLELWHRAFMGSLFESDSEINSVENSLRQKFARFKFTYGDRQLSPADAESQLEIQKSPATRKKIWQLYSGLSENLRGDLLKLIRLRNLKARRLGFPNYYSLLLYLQAVDEGWLLKTFSSLEKHLQPEYEKSLAVSKKKLRLKEIGPWDLDYLSRDLSPLPEKYFPADSLISRLHRFEDSIGFKLDTLGIREIVVNDKFRSVSFALAIPSDIRMVLRAGAGLRFYTDALDAYGSALKARFTSAQYPILKDCSALPGTFNPAYDRGIGQVHAGFTEDSLWLTAYSDAKEKEIHLQTSRQTWPGILKMCRSLKSFYTGYELYKNPSLDPDSLERSNLERFLGVTADSGISLFHEFLRLETANPPDYHSHILSQMIVCQIQEALGSKFGPRKISTPLVGRWLIEHLYSSGETEEWYDRIRSATGKSLEPGAYLRTLAIENMNLITSTKEE